MKIIATSDLHVDISAAGNKAFLRISDKIAEEKPDLLLIAGDTAADWHGPTSSEHGILEWALKHLKDSVGDAPVAAVAGNHDIWRRPLSRPKDSLTWLDETWPEICRRAGVHCLDKKALIVASQEALPPARLTEVSPKVAVQYARSGAALSGNIGIVGSIGWYDYSLGDPNTPREIYARKTFGKYKWMDGEYVILPDGMDDESFTRLTIDRISKQIALVRDHVESIISVTHMCPFRKLHVPGTPYFDAFGGSVRIGEMLLMEPKVKYAICGHRHVVNRAKIGHIDAVMIGSDYEAPEYVALEV